MPGSARFARCDSRASGSHASPRPGPRTDRPCLPRPVAARLAWGGGEVTPVGSPRPCPVPPGGNQVPLVETRGRKKKGAGAPCPAPARGRENSSVFPNGASSHQHAVPDESCVKHSTDRPRVQGFKGTGNRIYPRPGSGAPAWEGPRGADWTAGRAGRGERARAGPGCPREEEGGVRDPRGMRARGWQAPERTPEGVRSGSPLSVPPLAAARARRQVERSGSAVVPGCPPRRSKPEAHDQPHTG